MSIYKWLNQDIITDDYGYIEYVFTDWSAMKAIQDSQYPQKRIISHKIKLLSISETEDWIINKLAQVSLYESLDNSKLIRCSDEELWRTSDKYKYYKKNKAGIVNYSRATKVFSNEFEANHKRDTEGGAVILIKGEIKRCKYCNFTNICEQYLEYKKEGLV
jgi:beta-glucosidase-like glycosyl hydrolase